MPSAHSDMRFSRLKQVKQRYDPINTFYFSQSIKPVKPDVFWAKYTCNLGYHIPALIVLAKLVGQKSLR
jgi:hypothetical protein